MLPVGFTIPVHLIPTPTPPQLASALKCVFHDRRVVAISVVFDDTRAGLCRTPSVHLDDGNGLRTITTPDAMEALAISHLAQALCTVGWAWSDRRFHAERADVWEHLFPKEKADRALPELFFTRHGAALRRTTDDNLGLHFLAGMLRSIDPDIDAQKYENYTTGWVNANPLTIGALLMDTPQSAHAALSLAARTQALTSLWERLALINTPLNFPIQLTPVEALA